jgi:hypothetical protein
VGYCSGIRYAPGGVESGFRKVVKDVYEPRLLHLKVRQWYHRLFQIVAVIVTLSICVLFIGQAHCACV